MYLRDVVEEPRYTEDLDNYRRLYPEIDDVQAIISWTLSRQPTIGLPIPFASDFRLFGTTAFKNVPAFWILYSLDAERVYLHSIQRANE